MSDLDDDEIMATRLDNGSTTIFNLLDHWRYIYEIPAYEIDKVKKYIEELEEKQC